jgi:hypothetical protein
MPKHFIVVAPPYSARSGGVMVLHELCTALNKIGEQAGIVFIKEGSQKNQDFKFGYSSENQFYDPYGSHFDFVDGRSSSEIWAFIQDAFVIYPDIIKGNPLGAKSFATYVLGFPKFDIDSPFIISYSKCYTDSFDCVLYKPFISEYMHNRETLHWTQRNLCLTYIGKGHEYELCGTIPNTILVERDWPRDKQQLALLLRQCKYFFTWDCLSATNIDAVLCGAVPVLMQTKQLSRATIDGLEPGPLPSITFASSLHSELNFSQVSEIDKSMSDMESKLNGYSDRWLEYVVEFVNILKNKYNFVG